MLSPYGANGASSIQKSRTFTFFQWIANGQSGPTVIKHVVQDIKQDPMKSRHNMVVKVVKARTKRVAKSKNVQVSQLLIQLFPLFPLSPIFSSFFTFFQWIANGHSGLTVIKHVVQDTKQDPMMWRHNIMVKLVKV